LLGSSETWPLHGSTVKKDEPPVFVQSSLSVTLPENSANGDPVTTFVTVTDQDVFGGNVAWFNQTYSITGGNTQGLFGATTSFLVASPAPTQPNALRVVVANGGPLIAGTSSQLQLLNFENAQQNAFSLLVRATDGGGMSSTATVSIALTDVNEAPAFTDLTLARSIDETCKGTCTARSAGLSVTAAAPIAAADPDIYWLQSNGAAQTLTFALVSASSAGATYFAVSSAATTTAATSGAIITLTSQGALTASLDFEVVPSYVLLVSVSDGTLTSFANVTVNLNNRNEPPVFNSVFTPQPGSNQQLPAFSVPENAAIATFIGANLSTTPGLVDPEDALGAGLSVSITGGNTGGAFGIVASSGQLFVASPLKFETLQSYTLTLALRDSGAPEGSSYALTTTTTATVTVGHVNKAPSITTSPCVFSVNENSNANTELTGSPLLASDPDVRDRNLLGDLLTATAPSFTATLSPYSTPNPQGFTNPKAYAGPSPLVFAANSITASPSTGANSFAALSNYAFDFETTPSFTVTVRVTDAGIDGAPLQASTTCTLNVQNVNEAPWFSAPLYRFSVSQNAPLNTVVGTTIAYDQDYADTLTYSLTSVANNNSFSSAPVFAVNGATGAIYISKTSGSSVLLTLGAVYCQSLLVTDAGGLTNLNSQSGYAQASTVCLQVVASNNPPIVFPSTFSVP